MIPQRSLTLVALLTVPAVLAAQPPAMSGIVNDVDSRTPLECLHVALLDASENAIAHTVTDAAGTFVVAAPAPGSFRLLFDVPSREPQIGPVTVMSMGSLNEAAYPVRFRAAMDGQEPHAAAKLPEAHWDSTGWTDARQTFRPRLRYPDFVPSARKSVVSSTFRPAQMGGAAVCQLLRHDVLFSIVR
ncbi:MAG: carboxypeptidase-like regulatory domain-containing protein [bacterium]